MRNPNITTDAVMGKTFHEDISVVIWLQKLIVPIEMWAILIIALQQMFRVRLRESEWLLTIPLLIQIRFQQYCNSVHSSHNFIMMSQLFSVGTIANMQFVCLKYMFLIFFAIHCVILRDTGLRYVNAIRFQFLFCSNNKHNMLCYPVWYQAMAFFLFPHPLFL